MADYRQCHISDNGISLDVRKLLSLRGYARPRYIRQRLVSQRKNEGGTSLAL